MANQLNFGNTIQSLISERMFRPNPDDENATIVSEKTNIFGTNPNDNVELWFYRPDGTLAGNTRLAAENPAVELSTVLDGSGAYEFINLNFQSILDEVKLSPGRYVVAAYFYRDEVGSLSGYKLQIKDISPSRTEVILVPNVNNDVVSHDIHEFVIPSVPRIFAKALVDQIFTKDLDPNSPSSINNSLNILNVTNTMNTIYSDTLDRINRSNSLNSYQIIFDTIKQRTYDLAIQYLKDDYQNINVQKLELEKYITDAAQRAIYEVQNNKSVDPKLVLI